MVDVGSEADPSMVEMLFDPQTSGGLLISIPEQNAEAIRRKSAL